MAIVGYWEALEFEEAVSVHDFHKHPNDYIIVDERTGIAYTGQIGNMRRDVETFVSEKKQWHA